MFGEVADVVEMSNHVGKVDIALFNPCPDCRALVHRDVRAVRPSDIRAAVDVGRCALAESAPDPQALKGAMFGEVADVVEMSNHVGKVDIALFNPCPDCRALVHRDVRAVRPSDIRAAVDVGRCALAESAPDPQALKGAMFGEVADVVEMSNHVGKVEHRPFLHPCPDCPALAHRDVRAVRPSDVRAAVWCRVPCLDRIGTGAAGVERAMFGEVADVVEMSNQVGKVEHRPFQPVPGLSAACPS